MTVDVLTLSGVLRTAAETLRSAGVPDAMADARILAATAFGLSREQMLLEPHAGLAADDNARFEDLVRRRASREPVGRILGYREFRSLDFALGPDTLEPRPDSETIVECALDSALKFAHPVRVLDIGTGTGCLLLSILNELPDAQGVGTDISSGAVEVASANAQRLGLQDRAVFVQTDWTDGIEGPFDLIVSNPPYIETDEISTLAPEVSRFDPAAALDGGADGLSAYRELASRLDALTASSVVVVVEIGAGQVDSVRSVFETSALVFREARHDLGGHPRGIVFARETLSKG